MCGIVGVVAERNATPILIRGLQRLEYRGYDSAGVAVLDSANAIQRCREVGKVQSLIDALAAEPLSGGTGIAHTRWATHGKVTKDNAHPHRSGGQGATKDLSLVHNGIIENHVALREELQQQGYEFRSQTDSEVVAHLVHHYWRDNVDLLEAVRKAVRRLEGAYAIAVIAGGESNRIIAARQGCPLILGKGIGENYLASDVLALRAVTDRFIYLEEGDLVDLRPDSVAIWNIDDESVIRSDVRVEMEADDMERGNYRHFMQKEMFQQPDVVLRALEGRVSKTSVLDAALGEGSQTLLSQVEAVTIVACGTSYLAGSVARYWIEELTGLPCQVEIASEYRYRQPATPKNSLFITISQSGETADTLAALRLAKESGFLATLTLCNVPTSATVRESDLAMMLNAGTEVGVASTKAFVAQTTALMLVTLLLGRHHGLAREFETEIVKELHQLPEVINALLALDKPIEKLAEKFAHKEHALYLGRGSFYPIALEGALKLKELSYIHAEGYAAGELKHGPLALVDENMPVVAIAPNDELLEKLYSNLQEVRSRGGELYVFVEEGVDAQPEEGIVHITLPACNKYLAPIAYVVPLQLLAYHIALIKGTDVDQPRNLAKSVTVE
jgi:glucosamine--fructose-6-phosphate aminotransferase (isomerizing)